MKHSTRSYAPVVPLLMLIFSASIHAARLQSPARVSEVAELVTTVKDGGSSYQIFRYEGLLVRGDMLLKEYSEGTAFVRARLLPGEQMIEVSASQQISVELSSGADLTVRTCTKDCRFDSGTGRVFLLKRVNGVLDLITIRGWIT
jgi:hypothetical protein